MAVVAIPSGSIAPAPKPLPSPKPLSVLGLLLLPILIRLNPGARSTLERRAELGRKAIQQKRNEREIKRELFKEAKVYGALIRTTWARLEMYHRPRTEYDGPERRQKKKKTQYVKYEYIGVSPEQIYFKILTRKRVGPAGFIQHNALPLGVRVLDLVKEETLEELSYACHRRVQVVNEDPRRGVWIVVNRLQGMDGLPNRVTFEQVLEHYPVDQADKAPIVLGVGEHRKVHTVYLAEHPHVLIAGSTGGGKSNMINSVISQLMRFTDPALMRFTLIDLKRMEFGFYEQSPHLAGPVVFTVDDAIETLEKLIEEVLDRAGKLSSKAKELSVWNKKYPDKAMPRLIVVIDEFAELVLSTDKDSARKIKDLVTRIVNLGRAVGVHLIICTQRPATEVVSNAIKINMPLVIAGRTQSASQSQVIVDNGDAADLPLEPRGRMLYLAGPRRSQIQTPLIEDDDVRESVRIARGRSVKLLTLAGYSPAIDTPKLIEWLGANKSGELSPAIGKELFNYGITRAAFSAFCTEVAAAGLARKEAGTWRLIPSLLIPSDVPAPEPEPDQAPAGEVPVKVLSESSEESPDDPLTEKQRTILSVLADNPNGLRASEIESITEITHGSTVRCLVRLLRDGFVVSPGRGHYQATPLGIETLDKEEFPIP